MPPSKILMQVKNGPALKWPKPMRSHPERRNKGKYCCFHKDHEHDTDDCHDLKDQIENLIQQGKLKGFVGQSDQHYRSRRDEGGESISR